MTSNRTGSGPARLLVPAYAHPNVAPGMWDALADPSAPSRLVVMNVADGPGDGSDHFFGSAAVRLRAANATLIGYLDTQYGYRPFARLVADAEQHLRFFDVEGFFLDQTSADGQLLPHYRRLAVALRSLGARVLVLNPGVHPDPGYAEVTDVLVTHEGPWDVYRDLESPSWVRDFPAERFAHLVHSVPPGDAGSCAALVAARHVGTWCATEGTAPNPWDRLPFGFGVDRRVDR